jgi:glycerophosphoryl diester phosphodiesterase
MMKKLTFLLTLTMVMGGVMFFWACQGQKKCDKRAQYVIDQIHNPKSDQVLVICHRGDWRNFPENSIPAIEAVIKMGADVVELDVALTKDSVLILMHDRTLDRCSTGKGLIAEKSYDEIKNLRLKSAHGAQNSLNLPIPTLREALEVCRDRIVVNIDKGYDYYDLVLALTEEMGVTDQILIKGSKPLADIKEKLSKYENNMMYMPIVSPQNVKSREMLSEYLADKEPQLAYEVCWNKLTPEVEQAMKEVIADGSKLWVNTLWNSLCGGLSDDVAYTTSVEEVYGKIVDMGATMIQTDRPELLLDYLRSRGLHD